MRAISRMASPIGVPPMLSRVRTRRLLLTGGAGLVRSVLCFAAKVTDAKAVDAKCVEHAVYTGLGVIMKIGLSSSVCPEWDLQTFVSRAAEAGFDGIELAGLQSKPYALQVPEVADNPEKVRELCTARNLELIGLSTPLTFESKKRAEVEAHKADLKRFMGLAGLLGARFVRCGMGKVGFSDTRRHALGRIAEQVASLVPLAAETGVTLLIENSGDFVTARDVWFAVDAAGHAAVQCCWNQCHALTRFEHATISLPQIAQKVGLVHLADCVFEGGVAQYRPLGQGNAEIALQVELLTGLVYDGYVVLGRPEFPLQSTPEPGAELAEAVQYLRGLLAVERNPLSAYKSDKRPVKLALRATAAGVAD